jgi:hypothetical protein
LSQLVVGSNHLKQENETVITIPKKLFLHLGIFDDAEATKVVNSLEVPDLNPELLFAYHLVLAGHDQVCLHCFPTPSLST